jgi:hypothetical protein
VTALQNSCLLINEDFLKAKKCTSIILTKIEDQTIDKEIFDDQIESLKEDFS